MPEDLMRYDLLAQDALRAVVRSALAQVARSGLPGEHHLFIAINTRHEGVHISERLRQKYPEEITIVLQHQFWNLEVREAEFSVELTFNNVLERLVVPFAAIKGFFDPAVQFGLQFDSMPVAPADVAEPVETTEPEPLRPELKAEAAGAGGTTGAAEKPPEGDGRKVVSLDQFRKK
jgi:hypothetical protein